MTVVGIVEPKCEQLLPSMGSLVDWRFEVPGNDVLEIVVETLRRAGRPLSVRRLHRLCSDDLEEINENHLDAVQSAIQEGIEGGQLEEVRSGIISLATKRPSGKRGKKDVDEDLGDEKESPGNRRRKRISRQAKARAGFPAAPISLDETAAMSAQSNDRDQLIDALWKRIHRKAAEIVGQPVAGTIDAPDDDLSLDGLLDSLDELADEDLTHTEEPAVERSNSRRRRRPRRERNREEEFESPDLEANDEAFDPDDPIQRLKGRVRPGGRTYRESRRRPASEYSGQERRGGRVLGFEATDGTVASTQGVLRRFGEVLSLENVEAELSGDVGRTGALRATLTADNEQRTQRGLRPLFYFDGEGRVGLTEWDFPPRYEALELRVSEAIAEQAELVRRALLQRAGELDEQSFAQLIVLLLSRVGFDGFEQLSEASDDELVMIANRRLGLESGKVVVVARNTWQPVDVGDVRSLADRVADLEASSGVLLTIGTFTGKGVTEAARMSDAAIRLVDGQGLAELMYENDLGVRCHRLPARYLDGRFFETLGE